MTMLCTICARGGSKGVVGKNARDLLGKPLLAWTIEQARRDRPVRGHRLQQRFRFPAGDGAEGGRGYS